MERIAIAMQDGGTGAGAQHGDAGREANLILSCRRTSIWDPRGGLFGFKYSSRRHPRKCGVKRFLVVREVAGAVSGVACFWVTSLKKDYRRRDRDRLVPLRWMDAAVSVPRCAILSVGSTGVTSREGARATASDAGDRVPGQSGAK